MLKALFGKKDKLQTFERTLLNFNSIIARVGKEQAYGQLSKQLNPMLSSVIQALVEDSGKNVFFLTDGNIEINYHCNGCDSIQPHSTSIIHRFEHTETQEREAIISCNNCGGITIDEPFEKLNIEIKDTKTNRVF